MNADFVPSKGLGLPQKLVELRPRHGPRLMASVSANETSVTVPVPNEQGGKDQITFRYSGAKDQHGIEIWAPDDV